MHFPLSLLLLICAAIFRRCPGLCVAFLQLLLHLHGKLLHSISRMPTAARSSEKFCVQESARKVAAADRNTFFSQYLAAIILIKNCFIRSLLFIYLFTRARLPVAPSIIQALHTACNLHLTHCTLSNCVRLDQSNFQCALTFFLS